MGEKELEFWDQLNSKPRPSKYQLDRTQDHLTGLGFKSQKCFLLVSIWYDPSPPASLHSALSGRSYTERRSPHLSDPSWYVNPFLVH